MSNESVIGAFSELQVSNLSGLTLGQVRRWRRMGFLNPSYRVNSDNPRKAYSTIYSFRDLLILRVLGVLSKEHKIPLRELKSAGHTLSEIGDGDWASTRLWVANKKVIFVDPRHKKKMEATSGQYVVEIELEVVTTSAKAAIKKYNKRDSNQIGKTEKKRYLQSSQEVFSGTRIPVKAIVGYINAGYSNTAILKEYPVLKKEDIERVRLEAA